MRTILKTPPGIAGIALLSTTAMLSLAQPAAAAKPDRGAAAIGEAVKDVSDIQLVQYRPVARRTAVATRRYVGRPVVRRAAVVAATTTAVTVQPAVYAGGPMWGWPFWWNRPAAYTGYATYPGYASYASAAIPRAAITTPARVIRAGSWVRPREYWWQPGGAIAAGVAWTAWPAASASPWIGAAPDQSLCWYRTSPFLLGWNGFWDVCAPGSV